MRKAVFSYLGIEILVCFEFCVLNKSWWGPHWLSLLSPLSPCPLRVLNFWNQSVFSHISSPPFQLPGLLKRRTGFHGSTTLLGLRCWKLFLCFQISLCAFSSGTLLPALVFGLRQVRTESGWKVHWPKVRSEEPVLPGRSPPPRLPPGRRRQQKKASSLACLLLALDPVFVTLSG